MMRGHAAGNPADNRNMIPEATPFIWPLLTRTYSQEALDARPGALGFRLNTLSLHAFFI